MCKLDSKAALPSCSCRFAPILCLASSENPHRSPRGGILADGTGQAKLATVAGLIRANPAPDPLTLGLSFRPVPCAVSQEEPFLSRYHCNVLSCPCQLPALVRIQYIRFQNSCYPYQINLGGVEKLPWNYLPLGGLRAQKSQKNVAQKQAIQLEFSSETHVLHFSLVLVRVKF